MNNKLLRKIIRPITNFIWPVTIINEDKFVEGKGVYVCNHYSMIDPVPFYTELFENNFNALMKEEAINFPIIGKILLKVGGIPVKRGEADMRAMKKCLTVLRHEEPLIVFPEGARNKSGSKEMLELKDGVAVFAIKTQSPVIPMMYARPIKPFRRTYLMIGTPFELQEYYGQNINDVRFDATEKIKNSMVELREQLDHLLQDKKALKSLLKEQKQHLKQIKKMNKIARKQSKKAKKDSITVEVEK